LGRKKYENDQYNDIQVHMYHPFPKKPGVGEKEKVQQYCKKKEDQRCKILDLLFNTVLEIEMPGPE